MTDVQERGANWKQAGEMFIDRGGLSSGQDYHVCLLTGTH